MRLVAAAAAVAALGFAAAGATAQPVSTAPLAPGEVLLEVSAMGTARSRADLASFTAFVVTYGATAAEARRANEQAVERVRAAARSAGIAPGDIRADDVVDPAAYLDPSMMMVAMTEGRSGLEPAEGGLAPRQVAGSSIEIRLPNPARASQLKEALREAGAERVTGPTYALSDERPARRAARADAIATARADAEGYAASLGMRVLRIVRVTDRVGMDMFSMFFGNPMMTRRLQGAAQSGPEVETDVVVGVDFALAPQ